MPHDHLQLNFLSVNYPPGIKDHPPSIGHVCWCFIVLFSPFRRNQQPASEKFDTKMWTMFSLRPSSRFRHSSTRTRVRVLAPQSNTGQELIRPICEKEKRKRIWNWMAHNDSIRDFLLLPRDANPFESFRWRPRLVIVKLVRFDSNANDLSCVDVHAFGGLGIEHVVYRWFAFAICG